MPRFRTRHKATRMARQTTVSVRNVRDETYKPDSSKTDKQGQESLCGCKIDKILSICDDDVAKTGYSNHGSNCHQSYAWLVLAAEYFTALNNANRSGCSIPSPGCDIEEAFVDAENCLETCHSSLSFECIALIRELDQWNSGDCSDGPPECDSR